jgi:hypothetical protein
MKYKINHFVWIQSISLELITLYHLFSSFYEIFLKMNAKNDVQNP